MATVPKIFIVTTIEKIVRDDNPQKPCPVPDFGDYRSVGWYADFDSAKRAVENNYCDIHEGLYDYAVIEECEEGLYPENKATWFKWNGERYLPIRSPLLNNPVENGMLFCIG